MLVLALPIAKGEVGGGQEDHMTILYNIEIKKYFRKKLRKSMPKGEILLWQKLKNKQIGYKFRRQYSVGSFIIDFYCPDLRLGVEVDGRTHDRTDDYDMSRQKYLESKKITIVRFNSAEIFDDADGVASRIYYICKDLDKLPPPTPSLARRGAWNPRPSPL
ncbi:MAG TPA: DUF559 domain-containing protein [bacterium]|nr:DUF559 domain-containing protein [bacterium]